MKRVAVLPWLGAVLVGATLVLAALAWRAGAGVSAADYEYMVEAIRRSQVRDVRIDQPLLAIHLGITRHYDDLTARVRDQHAFLARFDTDPRLRAQLAMSGVQPRLAALRQAAQAQEQAVEHFKRHFAVLRNAARYLPTLVVALGNEAEQDGRHALAHALHDLLRAALSYNAMPTPEFARAVRAALEALAAQRAGVPAGLRASLDVVAQHTRTLLTERTEVQALTQEILALPVDARHRELRRAYQGWYDRHRATAARYQNALGAASVALAAYLGYLVWQWLRLVAALRASERHVRDVLDGVYAFVGVMTPQGVLTEANRAALEAGGITREDAVGKPLDQAFWFSHSREAQARMRSAIERAARGDVVRYDDKVRMAAGPMWVDIAVVPLRDARGRITNLIPSGIDISERKRAEDALHRLNAELEARVRQRTAELTAANQELEAFSYSVSHDLRAPLRALHGFSAALVEDCGAQLDTPCRDHLQRIQAASEKMGRLIDDILQLSRITRTELNVTPLDLCALARQVAEALRQGEPGRAVELVILEHCPAHGDGRLLAIALGNLIGNAWKFTRHQAHPRIEFGVETQDGETVHFVRDNGVGFDMAYANKLFTAFQRLHPEQEFEGTGIGLSIVQRIVHRHGGRIWAHAAVGQGATFYFTLVRDDG